MKRDKWIIALIKGKDVLDIGSAADTGENLDLWNVVKANAATAIGIDVIKTDDPDIVVGDMENHDFGKKFDVIVAGDVIEHLNNPGLFLANVARHLKDDGKLIITTPNAKWWTVVMRPHFDHTAWYDVFTLRVILDRHFFQVDDFSFYPTNRPRMNFFFQILYRKRQIYFVCSKKRG